MNHEAFAQFCRDLVSVVSCVDFGGSLSFYTSPQKMGGIIRLRKNSSSSAFSTKTNSSSDDLYILIDDDPYYDFSEDDLDKIYNGICKKVYSARVEAVEYEKRSRNIIASIDAGLGVHLIANKLFTPLESQWIKKST